MPDKLQVKIKKLSLNKSGICIISNIDSLICWDFDNELLIDDRYKNNTLDVSLGVFYDCIITMDNKMQCFPDIFSHKYIVINDVD